MNTEEAEARFSIDLHVQSGRQAITCAPVQSTRCAPPAESVPSAGRREATCTLLQVIGARAQDKTHTRTLKSVTALSRLFFVFFATVRAVAKVTQKGDTGETKEKAGHRFLQLLSYATL